VNVLSEKNEVFEYRILRIFSGTILEIFYQVVVVEVGVGSKGSKKPTDNFVSVSSSSSS
jgi:hypothetical protein